jgi:hypothetical protein
MQRNGTVRRHADGALDLDRHRRLAGRLRRRAPRRFWRGAAGLGATLLARLAATLARLGGLAAGAAPRPLPAVQPATRRC